MSNITAVESHQSRWLHLGSIGNHIVYVNEQHGEHARTEGQFIEFTFNDIEMLRRTVKAFDHAVALCKQKYDQADPFK